MASIEKIVEGDDGVITVYFNTPFTVELQDISTKQPGAGVGAKPANLNQLRSVQQPSEYLDFTVLLQHQILLFWPPTQKVSESQCKKISEI